MYSSTIYGKVVSPSIHTHKCNAVPLVWGSPRLAPMRTGTMAIKYVRFVSKNVLRYGNVIVWGGVDICE